MTSSSKFIIDNTNTFARFAALPVPGENSRRSADPFVVQRQFQNTLAVAKHTAAQAPPQRRVVTLNLSILPTAASQALDISLPPCDTGGVVDVFWPSESASALIDETNIELPVLPPIQPQSSLSSPAPPPSSPAAVATSTAAATASSGGGKQNAPLSYSVDYDRLVQQQWLPTVSRWLKGAMCTLHREVALRGIQNKRWEFEASSYLASLPAEEWDVVVERSYVQKKSTSSPAVMMNNARNAAGSAMSTFAGGLGNFLGFSDDTNNNNNNNHNSKNNVAQQAQSSSASTTREPTKALHLSFLLFGSRSSNVDKAKKCISRVLKHAEQQLHGGEVKEQVDAVARLMSSSSAGDFAPKQQPPQDDGRDDLHGGGNNNDDPIFGTAAHSNPAFSSRNTQQQQQEQQPPQFEIESSLSLVLQISETASNEYNFQDVQNVKVRFRVVEKRTDDDDDHGHAMKQQESAAASSNSNDNHNAALIRSGAIHMLNELIHSEIKQSLPGANPADFSLLDFLPAVEEACCAVVERMAQWCKVLYGFSITFGPPLWDRVLIHCEHPPSTSSSSSSSPKTKMMAITTKRPPAFAQNAVYLFETPRSDDNNSVVTLYVHVARGEGQQHQQRRVESAPPSVNIVSAQLDRNDQPLMFSWVPSTTPSTPEEFAGGVLQYLVDALPKLQGLYRSLLVASPQQQQQQQQQQRRGGGGGGQPPPSSPASVAGTHATATAAGAAVNLKPHSTAPPPLGSPATVAPVTPRFSG